MISSFEALLRKFENFMSESGYGLIVFIGVFALGIFIIHTLMKIFKSLFLQSSVDKLLVKFFLIIIKITLYVILILLDLFMVGVDLTGYIAALSAIALAIGLSVKDIISGVASGLMILTTHPFRVGDYVDLGTTGGTIKEVNLFHTVINTPDNKRIMVPNKKVFDDNITNYSSNSRRRLDLIYSVDYDTDIDKALAVLLDVAKKNHLVLSRPEPMSKISEFGSSDISLLLRVWMLNENYWTVKFNLQEEVFKAFKENSIEIPFPQVTISKRKES